MHQIFGHCVGAHFPPAAQPQWLVQQYSELFILDVVSALVPDREERYRATRRKTQVGIHGFIRARQLEALVEKWLNR